VRRRVCELAEIYGGGAATIPLTQEDLAGMAGTSRATVNRVLRDDARRGLVELQRGRTVVLQPDELRRRAKIR
jgi:CRP/FNR family cyclic AMP-dependent transcriptional regulator